MCRLKEQLALYTPVKFKAFWPSANSGLDEELNSDLHKWGLLETEPSWSHSRDLAVAPILIQEKKGLMPILKKITKLS